MGTKLKQVYRFNYIHAFKSKCLKKNDDYNINVCVFNVNNDFVSKFTLFIYLIYNTQTDKKPN